MDKKVFDDAIGELPPSTVRVDEAIARGRRAARMRNVVAPTAGVALAVVLAIGAAAFTVMPGPTEHPAATERGGDGCELDDMVAMVDEPADVAKDRLTNLARGLVGERLAAGDRLTLEDALAPESAPLAFSRSEWEEHEKERLDRIGCDADLFLEYSALADIETNGRSAILGIDVSTRKPPIDRCDRERFPDTVCEQSRGAGGENIQTSTGVLDGNWTENNVWVDRPDGTTVNVRVINGSVRGGMPPWADPPLDVDQLREIALDPGMTLFP